MRKEGHHAAALEGSMRKEGHHAAALEGSMRKEGHHAAALKGSNVQKGHPAAAKHVFRWELQRPTHPDVANLNVATLGIGASQR